MIYAPYTSISPQHAGIASCTATILIYLYRCAIDISFSTRLTLRASYRNSTCELGPSPLYALCFSPLGQAYDAATSYYERVPPGINTIHDRELLMHDTAEHRLRPPRHFSPAQSRRAQMPRQKVYFHHFYATNAATLYPDDMRRKTLSAYFYVPLIMTFSAFSPRVALRRRHAVQNAAGYLS